MKDFLALVGMSAICVIGAFFIYASYCAVRELIDKLMRRYCYKHRFDKPPTAKCYCIDCKHHDKKTLRCYRFVKEYRCTADEWFCWEAEPREE